MSSFVVSLILLHITLLVTCTNCFNLSTVDKDELWHLLLNRQISGNITDALHLAPSSHNNNEDDLLSAVVVSDKVNEFHYDDVVDGSLSDDGVKVEHYDENRTADKNLQSEIMNIFNVSVVHPNETGTADDTMRENVSGNTVVIDSGDILSDKADMNENLEFQRDEMLLTTTPSIIAIDVIKPSETEGGDDDDDHVELIRSKGSTKAKPGQTSLVIVFDGTGSMENCLIQLRAGAKQIIDKFSQRDDNPIYNYIFVPFRDPRK